MSRVKLIAVNATMAYAAPALPAAFYDAYTYTTTFAQAVARTASTDITSVAYFDKMTHEYQVLGWNVQEARRLEHRVTGGRISPAQVISNIINPMLDAGQRQQLQGILRAIQSPSVRVSDFLTFWWNQGKRAGREQNLSIGPLYTFQRQPAVTIVHYKFNFTAESWRTLFVQRNATAISVQARYIKQALNMDLYRRVEPDLKVRLEQVINDHVKSVDLDI